MGVRKKWEGGVLGCCPLLLWGPRVVAAGGRVWPVLLTRGRGGCGKTFATVSFGRAYLRRVSQRP